MKKAARVSILPTVMAVSALFLVLPQQGADATIHILGGTGAWRFSPQSTVDPGDRVAFVNDTRVTHTATDQGGAWDTGDIQPGQTVFVSVPPTTKPAAGALFGGGYSYACLYHGRDLGMTGTLGSPTAATTIAPVPSPAPSA